MHDPADAAMLAALETDHHGTIALLRDEGPVVWLDAIDGWLVCGHAEAIAVLRDAEVYTVDDPRFSTAQVLGPSMLSLDGADHRRHRGAFERLFRRSAVGDLDGAVRRRATDRVASLAGRARIEWRTEFAAPLAVEVILDVLGLGDESVDQVLGWYRTFVDAVAAVDAGGVVGPDADAARTELRQATDAAGIATMAGLDLDEVTANIGVIMFGAIETTEGMIANLLWNMMTVDGLHDAMTHEQDLIPDVIEESLRFEPAAAVVDRYATCSAEIGGVRIGSGDFVRVSLAGANRDPAVFDDPHRFVVGRDQRDAHLAFVQGPHACLGLHLARLVTTEAVSAILDAPSAMRFDVAASEGPRGVVFRKAVAVVGGWESRS